MKDFRARVDFLPDPIINRQLVEKLNFLLHIKPDHIAFTTQYKAFTDLQSIELNVIRYRVLESFPVFTAILWLPFVLSLAPRPLFFVLVPPST
ncbi:hypothetical protein LXL04_031719 [Taraxacum kok-saghyz]